MSSTQSPVVAIAGSTGAVGQELITLLEERNFPIGQLKLLASKRSAGKQMTFKGEALTVEELTEDSFKGVDIALFSAGGSISKKFADSVVDANCVLIDNSSAFRMTEGVPLVVPEVNPEDLDDCKLGKGSIIANPNCSTIIMLLPLTPIHKKVGVKRIVVSTYQAASGAGAAAMEELWTQTGEVLAGKKADDITQDIFGQQYAFSLFSHNSDIQENGYNVEELKMVRETHKMWHNPDISVSATCIRVPVMRAHAESINLQLENDLSVEDARELLESSPGVSLIDDRANNRFPTPLDASGQDDVFVGRLRQDISQPEGRGLDLFVCGDQIRKGAALNAVQIAEHILRSS